MDGNKIRLKDVKHKVVVMSGKGGVGKSTVAVNLALALSMRGNRVGLLDSDIHGPTVPKLFGMQDERLGPSATGMGISPVEVSGNLEMVSMGFLLEKDMPVIWRGPLKMKAIEQFLREVSWGKLEYLIIDLPPGTGDEPLSIAQLLPDMDGAIIVTTPQDVALISVRRAITFARALNLEMLGIIENMSGFVCPNCGAEVDIFGKGGGERAAREMGVEFLGSIPLDPTIVESGEEGKPFILEMGDSVPAKRFDEISDKIEKILEAKA
jgi:Mrp family chromosome partitioning ATPase